jgi:4-alpha-glucanotransferase
MNKARSFGILMPISSLPSPYGIGTFGKEAFAFVDFLSAAKAKVWQILPLGVTSYGDSPYQSPSANGLNYYFIDLDALKEEGLLTQEEIDSCDFGRNPSRVDYGKLFENRLPLLRKAFGRFDQNDPSFAAFVQEGTYKDFAFFMTLKTKEHFAPWYAWPEELRNYTPELEERVLRENREDYLFFLFTQYVFLKQFTKLKDYAHSKGIQLLGDMPLYLAYDSVECYKHPELFLLDSDRRPVKVAGCPPDAFSPDGQLWGNPIYDWAYQKKTGYAWFDARIKQNLSIFDILRIDHFRGFAGYYTIPYGDQTARNGKWEVGPGFDFFRDKTDLPIIAEDLGFLDDAVKNLLRETGYPGMKVLEFAFDGDPSNAHKPSNSTENYVCYTGTHDNETIVGYLSHLNEREMAAYKSDVRKECALFQVPYRDETVEDLGATTDELCLAGRTFLSVLPIWDILLLGNQARMNTPSKLSSDNWVYRSRKEDFSPALAGALARQVEKYGR